MGGGADRWGRENVKVYGRALVANTLVFSKIKFRADVNGVTEQTRKEVKEIISTYVYKTKKREPKWETMIRSASRGGVGLRDPDTMIDAAKVRIVRNMHLRSEQPWVKWMRRKEERVRERWGLTGSVYSHKIKRKQRKGLKETCVYECIKSMARNRRNRERHGRREGEEVD